MKNKILISIALFAGCLSAYSQNSSSYNSLNVKPDYDQRRQDAKDNIYYLEQHNKLLEQQLVDKKSDAATQIMQIKQWYNSLTSYPVATDGEHSVFATDNDMAVITTIVTVKDGKVIKIGQIDVYVSSPVSNARCQIMVHDNNYVAHSLDLYFTN